MPGGKAVLATLGKDETAVDLPSPSPSLHVHASSPCTDLSIARGRTASSDEVDEGVRMLKWSLDLVLQRGDHSWSLENVSTPKTRAVLTEYASKFPGRVSFASLDAADFGAAQSRIRLIAGPSQLINLLQEMPSARRVSVREAFALQGLVVPAPCFKNQTRSRDGTPCRRSVEEQAFTVCASHALTWVEHDGRTVKVMSAHDSAVLMGFKACWRLAKGSRNAQRMVGNALCVPMARAIMVAAISIETGTPIPTCVISNDRPTLLEPTIEQQKKPSDFRRLKRRIRTIETLVREIHCSTQSATTQHSLNRPVVC